MLKVGGPTGLDALDRLDAATLGARYAEGRVPASMRAVDGPLPGRMLAVIGLAAARAPLRGFASSAAFPWEGKTFRAADDLTGAGINRIRLPGLLGRQDLFPFHTRFGPSAVDGAPALILDYDLAVNPPWIRAIHDEIREVDPGLFLGPAMWKAASGPVTVLWFGLDARCAAP